MVNNVTASQNIYQNNMRYNISQEKLDEIKKSHDHLVEKTPLSRVEMFSDKFVNAFTIYPAKGLKGSRDSNFYEFLTMGMVPYTIGSLTLIGLFNGATKHFKPHAAKAASRIGTKMGLGVLFYGIAKELSKNLISVPVNMATGVDTNMPYQKWIHEFSTSDFAPSPKSVEYHKVFESVDFPRYDLLYYKKSGQPRNYYYDKIAQKLGKGKGMEASDQEVKEDIRKIVIRSRAATALSSFLWAATGVAYAAQDSWGDLFARKMNNVPSKNGIKDFTSRFWSLAKKSAGELWNGTGKDKKINAIAGRTLVGAAVLSTVIGVLATTIAAKSQSSNQKVVDKNKEYITD